MPVSAQEIFDIRRYLDSQPLRQSMRIAICGLPGVGKHNFLQRYFHPRVTISPAEAALRRADAPPRRRGRRNPYITGREIYGRDQLTVWWTRYDWVRGVLCAGGKAGAEESASVGGPLANGYVLCYDVGDRESFEALREVSGEIGASLERIRGEEANEEAKVESIASGAAESQGKEEEPTAEMVHDGSEEASEQSDVRKKCEMQTPMKTAAEEIMAAHFEREAHTDRHAKKPFFVVACKSDRPAEAWEVGEAEGQAYATEIDASFMVSSAIRGEGIHEAVKEILGRVILAWLEVEGARRKEPLANPRRSMYR